MSIKNVTQGINLGNYRENGQWDIYRNVTQFNIENYDGILYSIIEFELFLRRKPLFMVMTIVLPSIILALLVILVFYLPADAGEKLSLGITLLLSFSVFQLLLAESLPRSSDYTPVICKTVILFQYTFLLLRIKKIIEMLLNIKGNSSVLIIN